MMNLKFSRALPMAVGLLMASGACSGAADLAPHLKVLLCTGDFGMYAQDRVPLLENAIAQAAPGANVSFEAHQSYNFTRVLESPGYANRFDVVVMGDLGVGQITPRAQANLVSFVQNGGGLVYAMWAKSSLPFRGALEANPMPLTAIVPYQYPDVATPRADATLLASAAPFWKSIDFGALQDPAAVKFLPRLGMERAEGKGRVFALAGAFGPSWKKVRYATYERVPGGWDAFPQLGEVWTRVLNEVAQGSPIRAQSRAQVDAKISDAPLNVVVAPDMTKAVDQIRAADFSIVALQQLYNEDGARGEDLFLDLNPRDWFDRRSQQVLPNLKGQKSDKPAFFREFNIKGIYLGDNSYGSYGKWDDAKYQQQIDKAVAAKAQWPDALRFLQAGNEPPLNQKYIEFHRKFVGGVLAKAPDYQVIGPNKAFSMLGVDPAQMDFYLDNAGKTTDILNWHTYAQPPSMTLSEARYWSARAVGKMRNPGAPQVMFTESDAWNQGDSQFNYLMDRALTFLPDKTILANFQYCMRPRSEGGPYRFGVLQPDGEFEANYNGYWVWRNLRGQMAPTVISGAPSDAVRAISSRGDDGKTFTTVIYYGTPYFDGAAHKKASSVQVSIRPKLPPGAYKLAISHVSWDARTVRAGDANAPVNVELKPYSAVALTWTKP